MNSDILGTAIPLFAQAALLTVRISIIGIVLAVAVGIICATVRELRVPVLRQIAGAYIELSRNTPLLIQLVFLYYGLPKAGIVLSGETCAIIGLAFLGGSYMAEAFRSGLDAVPTTQYESSVALGLSRMQALRTVLLPQAFVTAVPGLTANLIFLVKETSVVSIIALPDLVYCARDMMGVGYHTDEALLLLVASYFIILVPVAVAARIFEKKARRYVGTTN
ncbi:MAG: amino acid ABC transporter permease [Actinomycetaceae bacterium]|nr:amino acid ABC transporter permease [Actinomycetaceae bacterium]MDY5273132.1 amino acid ABC transporter permease [Arcanobacterium sp.]